MADLTTARGATGMLLTSAAATFAKPRFAFAQAETIEIGVLHSLSGTVAISETTLKDTMLMLIERRMPRAACWASNWKPWSRL